MNLRKKRILLMWLLVFMVFLILNISCGSVLGDENTSNISLQNKSSICLQESRDIMEKMKNEGFSIQRVNDSLRELENLYNAQMILYRENKNYDFSLVLPYCEEIKTIEKNAFGARDELIALRKFYQESLTEDMNTSSADEIISEIEGEINNERYEKVKPLVDEAYEEIINIKSSHTTLNLFYKTTTRTLKDFFYENWIYIVSFIVVLVVLFLTFRKSIKRWWIKRKITKLEIRKKTLKNLISQTQKDYFQNGNIPEGTYNIRTKKFAELIRDVERQIPLLKEELVKAGDRIKR